ncbi:MAG: choice-of-anchor D domain-containing protein, partial [Terracidiphilus sp.]
MSTVSSTQAVTLTASAGGVAKSFALQLNADAPALSLSTTNISFGNVPVGRTATLPVVLTSTGTAPLTIMGISVAGSLFTASGITPSVTLNPGQAATLNIQFNADQASSFSGKLTISSNSATNPTATVNMSGS